MGSIEPNLNIALQNQTTSKVVYAYITGKANDKTGPLVFIQADGKSLYYPTSPASRLSPLAVDCAIRLGLPGSTVTVTIPHISSGRIYFSIDVPLTFLLNPGPSLVEPSVSNPSDPNYNVAWDFCEFTFNSTEMFSNITCVDFVSLPISLTLASTTGKSQHVSGMPADGLAIVCSDLIAQNNRDKAGWNQLIVQRGGQNLRALSPNQGIIMNRKLFNGYYQSLVNQVWQKYATEELTIDTQAEWGTITGGVIGSVLAFPGIGTFAQPSAADIFSCSTGPFAVRTTHIDEVKNITARISAAFNRSTLLTDSKQPDGESVSKYYTTLPTNHYARIVHQANLDGRGYAFPYDDVGPKDGPDQCGKISDKSPALLTVAVGGMDAH